MADYELNYLRRLGFDLAKVRALARSMSETHASIDPAMPAWRALREHTFGKVRANQPRSRARVMSQARPTLEDAWALPVLAEVKAACEACPNLTHLIPDGRVECKVRQAINRSGCACVYPLNGDQCPMSSPRWTRLELRARDGIPA
jgi:hypothetical protein